MVNNPRNYDRARNYARCVPSFLSPFSFSPPPPKLLTLLVHLFTPCSRLAKFLTDRRDEGSC